MDDIFALGYVMKFFFEQLGKLNQLPQMIKNPEVLLDEIKQKKSNESFSIDVRSDIAAQYNQELDKLKGKIRDLSLYSSMPFHVTLVVLFIVRILSLVAAFNGSIFWALVIHSSQFLFAPLSLFASLVQFVALFPPLFMVHYAIQVCLAGILRDTFEWANFEITNTFIVLFFIIDHALCLACTFSTGYGDSKWAGWKKLITHALFGIIHTKSYTLMILLLSRGQKFSVILLLLDFFLGLTSKGSSWLQKKLGTHWTILFFHAHRAAHIPRVYEQGHKFHHYFHDTTAFDAHFYGSGMPEEFFLLFFEIFGASFGLLPTSLNIHTLMISLTNKVGHTRKEDASGGVNHHPDHHTQHIKNFSIYNCLLDMYFETNYPSNDEYPYATYIVTKKAVTVDSKNVSRFQFTPTTKGRSLEQVWNFPLFKNIAAK